MSTYNDAIRAIEGPLQEYVNKNTNIALVVPFELPSSPGNYGVRVGVRSLKEERRIRALGVGSFAVPDSLIVVGIGPDGKQSFSITVPVQIVEVGDLRALALINPPGKCPPGYSIGHPRMSAGTFGCLLSWDLKPDYAYILSNQHVLAGNNVGKLDDPIYQPGRYDGGTAFHTTAKLAAYINLDHIAYNIVDAALARVENDNTPPDRWADIVMSELPFVGRLNGITDPFEGMIVEIAARTSEHSIGQVKQLGCYAYPDYGPGLGVIQFKNQVETTPMARDGDSGAVVVEKSTKKLVGLLFAGSYSVTVFTPITTVLSELSRALGGGTLTLR